MTRLQSNSELVLVGSNAALAPLMFPFSPETRPFSSKSMPTTESSWKRASTLNGSELSRQPQGRFTSTTSRLFDADTGLVTFGIDPTRGQILATYLERPGLVERIRQGGVIGYVIITLGLIGMGRRLTGIAGAFSDSEDVQMVAVSDCVEERLQGYGVKRVQDLYNHRKRSSKGLKAHADFREIIADKSIDAVAIGTPDHWHAIMSIMAARAGKHVYCEKPLTVTIQAALETVKAARKNDIVYQVGSQQRTEFRGYFRKAVECIRNGRVGKVSKIKSGAGGAAVPPCELRLS